MAELFAPCGCTLTDCLLPPRRNALCELALLTRIYLLCLQSIAMQKYVCVNVKPFGPLVAQLQSLSENDPHGALRALLSLGGTEFKSKTKAATRGRAYRERARATVPPTHPRPGLAWPGLAWPGLAWPGLAWPGLAWPSPAAHPPTHPREENGACHAFPDSLWPHKCPSLPRRPSRCQVRADRVRAARAAAEARSRRVPAAGGADEH